ncbi:hypothetical protein RQP46_008608 [Phenoliferia psychrophenolica]
MLRICADAIDPADVTQAFQQCGGAHNLLTTLYPIPSKSSLLACPFVNADCSYSGNRERDHLRRHFKDKHSASIMWTCDLCNVTMGSGANGQISHEASHRGDVAAADHYAEL